MNFKKTVVTVLACLLLVGVLGGCSKEVTAPPKDTATPPQSTQPANPDADAGEQTQLQKFISVMGMSDADAVVLLGEGSPATDSATGAVLAREYTVKLFDQNVTASLMLDDGGLVSSVSILLPGTDITGWHESLKGELGDEMAQSAAGGSESNGKQEFTWTLDNCTLSLKSVFDTLSIELNPSAA